MKKVITWSMLLSMLAMSAFADEPKLCQVSNITQISITQPVPTDGYAIATLAGESARTLYAQMSDIAETKSESVPADVTILARIGKDIFCFKQLGSDCGFYQCNITFSDITKGELRKH